MAQFVLNVNGTKRGVDAEGEMQLLWVLPRKAIHRAVQEMHS
jgi:hypothetical protein